MYIPARTVRETRIDLDDETEVPERYLLVWDLIIKNQVTWTTLYARVSRLEGLTFFAKVSDQFHGLVTRSICIGYAKQSILSAREQPALPGRCTHAWLWEHNKKRDK
jgi:hypothetical protein